MGDLQYIIPINFNEWEVCRKEYCPRFTEGKYILEVTLI